MTAYNPNDKSDLIELSSDNLTATHTGNESYASVRSVISHSTGRRYFEARPTRYIFANEVVACGLATGFVDLNASLDTANWSGVYYCDGWVGSSDGNWTQIYQPVSVFEWAAMAVDFDQGKAWVRDSTGWYGDPEQGTGHSISFTPGTALFAICQGYYFGDEFNANFGNSSFVYPVPFGFQAWRTVKPSPPYPVDRDRHVRRNGDDYAQTFLTLLPRGQAWPKTPPQRLNDGTLAGGSTLTLACTGLSQYWGVVDGRAADLLERESDPRFTLELLPDWERAWGLPDECFPAARTIDARHRMLVLYMTWMGGQSRAYFQRLMEWLGFTVTVKEYAPFMCGISRVGDTRPTPKENFRWYIGPPEMRFSWSVSAGTPSFTWFRAGSGQAGVDHHLEIGIPDDLQCLLNRWKPAHTDLVMDYASVAFGGPMQGTP